MEQITGGCWNMGHNVDIQAIASGETTIGSSVDLKINYV